MATGEAGVRTLKNHFIEVMQSRILSGELKPGDRLPPERELAAELGLSRGSVNQGVLDLERMGFLRVTPRKGTYVAEFMETATPETLSAIMSYDSALMDTDIFRDMMEMRILIERECVRLACRRINSAARERLFELTERIYSAAQTELADALYDFHYGVAQLSGNSAYALVFHSFEKLIRNLIRAHYENMNELKKCLPLYDDLAAAISRGAEDEADMLMARILGLASDYMNYILSLKGAGAE